MAFNDLGSLLQHTVQRKGLRYQVEAARVLNVFDETVEELWRGQMKDRIKPLYLKDHILSIAVLSPLLAQELRMRQEEIIQNVNSKMEVEALHGLRFIS